MLSVRERFIIFAAFYLGIFCQDRAAAENNCLLTLKTIMNGELPPAGAGDLWHMGCFQEGIVSPPGRQPTKVKLEQLKSAIAFNNKKVAPILDALDNNVQIQKIARDDLALIAQSPWEKITTNVGDVYQVGGGKWVIVLYDHEGETIHSRIVVRSVEEGRTYALNISNQGVTPSGVIGAKTSVDGVEGIILHGDPNDAKLEMAFLAKGEGGVHPLAEFDPPGTALGKATNQNYLSQDSCRGACHVHSGITPQAETMDLFNKQYLGFTPNQEGHLRGLVNDAVNHILTD